MIRMQFQRDLEIKFGISNLLMEIGKFYTELVRSTRKK